MSKRLYAAFIKAGILLCRTSIRGIRGLGLGGSGSEGIGKVCKASFWPQAYDGPPQAHRFPCSRRLVSVCKAFKGRCFGMST